MVSQPLSDFMTDRFVKDVANTLSELGFVSDEHEFAPYRETMNTHAAEIELALKKAGYEFSLLSGFTMHSDAGYAYYIYDRENFEDPAEAAEAVVRWLDGRYHKN